MEQLWQQLRVSLMNDAENRKSSDWFPISASPHAVELDWRKSSAPEAKDGGLTLWIDGQQMADLAGVDNDTHGIDRVRLGAISGLDGTTRGACLFDAFESRRSSYIGP